MNSERDHSPSAERGLGDWNRGRHGQRYAHEFRLAQFTDHALIKLAEYTPSTLEFAYTVPVLANSSVTVAASQGNRDQGPYAEPRPGRWLVTFSVINYGTLAP